MTVVSDQVCFSTFELKLAKELCAMVTFTAFTPESSSQATLGPRNQDSQFYWFLCIGRCLATTDLASPDVGSSCYYFHCFKLKWFLI